MFKVKIRYVVIIVLAIIFSYLAGGTLPYSILYTLIIVFLLSLIHIIIQWYTIKVKLNLEKSAISTGEELYIYVIIEVLRFFPAPYIIVKNSTLENINKNYNGDIVTLNFLKEKIVPNDIKFNIRGVYDFSETKIRFTDMFCLIKCEKNFLSNAILRVYPKVYSLDPKKVSGKNVFQDTLVNMSISEDSNDIRDLRKYRAGDSLKKIHWKLSAKHSEFYVKNFSAVASKDVCIFINMNENNVLQQDQELIEEKAIDFAVSLINLLQRNGYKIKLFINNKIEKYFYIGTNEDFKLIMEYFVENKSYGNGSFPEFLNMKAKLLEDGAWIGIITESFDKSIINQVNDMKNMGLKVTGYYSCAAKARHNLDLDRSQYLSIDDILINENK